MWIVILWGECLEFAGGERRIDRVVGFFEDDDAGHAWIDATAAGGVRFSVVEVEMLPEDPQQGHMAMPTQNLDAMNADELLTTARNHQLVASYALLKRGAMEAREHGFAERALMIENACDTVYNQIKYPDRW